jgi:hypothetical protein
MTPSSETNSVTTILPMLRLLSSGDGSVFKQILE